MDRDPFSRCHPAVQFLFFLGAIGFGVVIQHPDYLLAGWVAAAGYYLLLHGPGGWRQVIMWLPVFVALTVLNPLFNPRGEHVLFTIFGRPYTGEALAYGGVIAGVFVVMMLWFGCYNRVMTSDKFMCLFGNWAPALSLLLVMVFRLVPRFFRQTRQLIGARRSVGKGAGKGYRDKVAAGMTVLSAMTSWALEGSVITAASMRSRGYGSARRSCFQIFRVTAGDRLLLVMMLVLLAAVLGTATLGGMAADFIPQLSFAPISGGYALGFLAYCSYLLIPTVLHFREALQWHILRSRI